MAVVGFSARLAYLRWLLSRGRLTPLSDTEFAEWLGVGRKWFGKWKTQHEPPNGRAEALAIGRAVVAIHGRVDALIPRNYDPATLGQTETSVARWARYGYETLWLACSPLGYFAYRFAQSLRADLIRWRGAP